MGLVDNRGQFRRRERGHIIQYAIGTDEVPSIHINLDPVRTVGNLLAHCFAAFLRSIYHLNAVRPVRPIPSVAEHRVRASHIHGACCHLHARTGNDASVNRVADVDVRIARAFGFQIADSRESIFQPLFRRLRSQDRAVRVRLLQDLVVIIFLGDVALQQHVRVRVDQSRQARLARQIDHLRSARRRRSDLRNLLSLDLHYHIAPRLLRPAVNQRSAVQIDRWFLRGRLRRGCRLSRRSRRITHRDRHHPQQRVFLPHL